MNLEIKWMPDVCSCVIMQHRTLPEEHYEFGHKCEIHVGLSDADARAAIIQLCIAKSEGMNGE